tara:strand:- start:4260 stop:6554 length:2295 start_codon:yes stop_codon:yes gene_type:complete
MTTAFDKRYEEILKLKQEQAEFDRINDNYALRKAQANLFFDDDTRLEFLASKRFPNDPYGALRYEIKDGNIMYKDDEGILRQEFPDEAEVGFFGDAVVPNLVPAANFAADVTGGILGAKEGFKRGLQIAQKSPVKHPAASTAIVLGSAALGGFGGNLVVGGGARGGRELLIDQFYNLPPEEINAAYKDLLVSSAFSAIPFGAGPTKLAFNKFFGKEDALRYLMNLKADDAATVIEEAKRFGIDLTPAEAGPIVSKAKSIQYFLSRQPDISETANKFYYDRAAQIRNAVETYAEELGSRSGRIGDPAQQAKESVDAALAQMLKKRKDRSKQLYKTIFDPEAGDLFKVDITPTLKLLDQKIANTGDPNTVKELEKIKELFIRDGQNIDNIKFLDDIRNGTLEKTLKENIGNKLGIELMDVKANLTQLMDLATGSDPEKGIMGLYERARRIYDPTKPALQLAEKSALGRIAKFANDKQTARVIAELFNPNVSVQSVRNAKRILRAVDPDAFKDIKKEFILQQLDRFGKQSLEDGLPRFTQYFKNPRVDKMMAEMLEPDEYENWSKLVGIMDRAFSVQKGGSVTQPLMALERQLAGEAAGLTGRALETVLAITRLPARIVSSTFGIGSAGDDITKMISQKQTQGYYDKIADVLFDPNASKSVDEAFQFINAFEFGAKQAATRAVGEGVEAIGEEDVPYRGPQREQYLQDLQSQLSVEPIPSLDIDMFEPLPSLTDDSEFAMSPTVVPSESDREIAMRQQQRRGLGSLV